jgi:hypothetical protein
VTFESDATLCDVDMLLIVLQATGQCSLSFPRLTVSSIWLPLVSSVKKVSDIGVHLTWL